MDQEKKELYIRALCLGAAVVGLFGAYWLGVSLRIPALSERGLFGDSFGGFTALTSGLAFAGMIYAIMLQGRELSLQREELRLTREEMKAAREQYSKSAEAQEEMVKKQMISAQIQGLSTMVSGRFQLASAPHSQRGHILKGVTTLESRLATLLQEVGEEDFEPPGFL